MCYKLSTSISRITISYTKLVLMIEFYFKLPLLKLQRKLKSSFKLHPCVRTTRDLFIPIK